MLTTQTGNLKASSDLGFEPRPQAPQSVAYTRYSQYSRVYSTQLNSTQLNSTKLNKTLFLIIIQYHTLIIVDLQQMENSSDRYRYSIL